jgi:hypothetical protein
VGTPFARDREVGVPPLKFQWGGGGGTLSRARGGVGYAGDPSSFFGEGEGVPPTHWQERGYPTLVLWRGYHPPVD